MTSVSTTVVRAAEVATQINTSSPIQRARWLTAAADALDSNVDVLVKIAKGETNLSHDRLVGEMARTTHQLRFFGEVVLDGAYLEVIIDHAAAAAQPPQPDLRRMLRPLGPVVVFAASNFPFAFSVAGGDTASAVAAGCPVIVKAHPGHRQLSRHTFDVVANAMGGAGAPDHIISLIEGRQNGIDAARHPAIKAVSFTGSLAAGRAIHDVCASRHDPIPFYGELASLNPVVVTVSADRVRGEDIAAGLVDSFTLGAGQFCTKPGIVFLPVGSHLEATLRTKTSSDPVPMLNHGIAEACNAALRRVTSRSFAEIVSGPQPGEGTTVAPTILAIDAKTLEEHRDLILDEIFGPVTILVRYEGDASLLAAIDALDGTLTATIHSEPDDDLTELLARLTEKAGRVLFDGWPTGVAVTWSQHHGGPWPATNSIHTSVGATAIRRFLRPIVYQDAPASVLPPVLSDENIFGVPRRVNGVFEPRSLGRAVGI